MKTRLFKWFLSVIILFSIFQTANIVKADDDDDEKYERHEKDRKKHDDVERKFKEYRDDDHDDDEDDDEYERDDDWQSDVRDQPSSEIIQQSLWNIWTRDTSTGSNDTLPIQEATEVLIEKNVKSELFFVIPQQGQLLVSGEKFAKFIGAEFTFYEQSRIFEILKGEEELIVRVGSNATYENRVKTPMPTKALYYEKSIYLPISVIANSMGYRVSWNAEKETIVLEEIF
ncbi:copper amine oxidase N-terminal domain-containing protein [Robertmurraya andreesenii]|uniref:Copper amine oxidase-like N-terminal domain-containing protein n=1 Tax=Anoxybacillus andreesenii TaxID=1325932 RepID=A0ABT9V9Y5_9BACL|nr:copper amine oxidase N-terminal domain-containing protein [Robertmurraya andreesenii]MDQ0157605.1 hypothetical protein [Robertmurraya andreesenii]